MRSSRVKLNSSSKITKLEIELEFVELLEFELELDIKLRYSSSNSNSSLIKCNQFKSSSIDLIRAQIKSNQVHVIKINILYIILNKGYY